MRDLRRMVGALCIVLAMVLGAFAGFSYAQKAGSVGVSPTAGTRGAEGQYAAISDGLPGEQGAMGTRTFAQTPLFEWVTEDGNRMTARMATPEEQREAARLGVGATIRSDQGEVTVQPQAGVRYSGPGIDAGGPYGGPDTFEGGPPLTFTVTAYDPAIMFFRWDFNNDGVFDYPDQTGGGTIGKWSTETTLVKQFFDNYLGNIVVQGWDGISTIVNVISGDNLGQSTTWNWTWSMIGGDYRWTGSRFTAKRDLTVTQLGQYKYTYVLYQMVLWDWDARVKLAECDPAKVNLQWNWCTLSTPVNLVAGKDYWLAQRVESTTTGRGPPVESAVARFQGAHYQFCYNTSPGGMYCFGPPGQASTSFMPTIDFRWTYTEILPDVTSDTAFLEIHNVAPTVSNVMTTPSPGLEGQPTYLTAQFSDPGLDDTWEYKWTFLDGTTSGWQPISKMNGGAKVLLLTTYGASTAPLKALIAAQCGSFCTKIDDLNWGPTGTNRVPSLSQLTPYDVLVVGVNEGAIPSSSGMGNVLADYMDAAGSTGGGVVMLQGAFDNRDTFGIGGRWQDDGYAPFDRGGMLSSNACLGTIYVPGHPLLDGVSTFCSSLRLSLYGVKTGATRIADFVGGAVAVGTKENPKVPNGARAVGQAWFPLAGYASGDYVLEIVNSIKWASRQPDPTIKLMPITTDPYTKFFVDDYPVTTTPQDTFGVHVDVRDDDDGKIEVASQTQLFFNNFENVGECTWSSGSSYKWPAGWSASPTTGWRCQYVSTFGSRGPTIQYSYNDYQTSTVNTQAFDFSGYVGVRLNFYADWRGDYSAGTSDGFIEVSTDGGATWSTEAYAFHHMNPGTFKGNLQVDKAFAGTASTMFRFRYVSGNDYWWFVDNLQVTGLAGAVINGMGGADGAVTIANVPPTITGGFDSAMMDEAQGLEVKGFQISDPALLASTEWFAYKQDFGDGTPSSWVYKGSLTPPKYKVLVIQSLCSSGNTCSYYTALRDALLAQDDVASVDGYNFFQTLSAPTPSTLQQYDVLMFGINYYYLSDARWDLVLRTIGDYFADYLDTGRGGVVTFFSVHASYSGYNVDLGGRYYNEKYGAFEGRAASSGAANGITKVDPSHDLFVGVGTDVNTQFVSSGNMPISIGGMNNAAGRNGVLLAKWTSTGNPAIGVKELLNGARTAHIGAFMSPSGSDWGMLLRNAVGWVAGGLPSPAIPPVTHTYGDNGVYTIDIAVIDDDMGYIWDAAANQPVQVMPGPGIGHRYASVAVNNVDPTIDAGSIQAFIAAEMCLRVSGSRDNTVTVDFYTDGVLSGTTSVTRLGSSPNPYIEKCGLLRIDVLAPHAYSAVLTYQAPAGGSNPTWLIIEPWREPVTPGHGTVTYKYDLDKMGGTINVPLSSLKADLIAGGEGAKIDFSATASDPGTDDLAFLWSWGTETGLPYGSDPSAVYTIHVHHNDGSGTTNGVLAGTQYLGFSEPYFDRAANSGLSPAGTMGFTASDTAVHAFPGGQAFYYVFLMVLDDDNGRGYPSHFLPDGIDVTPIVVDLR